MNTQETPDFIKHFDGKEAIKSFTEYQISRITEGIDNPLQWRIRATALKKALDNIDEKIKPLALAEAEKYRGEGKEISVFGAKIAFSDVGVRYDFSRCGDTVLDALNNQIKELTEKKKERENFLHTIKGSMTIADESTGEMITLYPPARLGAEGIRISF